MTCRPSSTRRASLFKERAARGEDLGFYPSDLPTGGSIDPDPGPDQSVLRAPAPRSIRRRQQPAPGREVRLHLVSRRPGQLHNIRRWPTTPPITPRPKRNGRRNTTGRRADSGTSRCCPSASSNRRCLKCHHQVTDLIRFGNKMEAPKLIRGYNLVRENGCFGCHEISGLQERPADRPRLRLELSPPLESYAAGRTGPASWRTSTTRLEPCARSGRASIASSEKTNPGMDRASGSRRRAVSARAPRCPTSTGLRNNARRRCPPIRRISRPPKSTPSPAYLFRESEAISRARTRNGATSTFASAMLEDSQAKGHDLRQGNEGAGRATSKAAPITRSRSRSPQQIRDWDRRGRQNARRRGAEGAGRPRRQALQGEGLSCLPRERRAPSRRAGFAGCSRRGRFWSRPVAACREDRAGDRRADAHDEPGSCNGFSIHACISRERACPTPT